MNKNKPPNFRKELQTNKKFNPFHQEYDFEYITNYIQNYMEFLNEEDIQTAYSTHIFNKYYHIYYTNWKEKIKSVAIPKNKLLESLINITNHTYFHVDTEIQKILSSKTIKSVNNVFTATMPSSTLDPDGVLEASIDTLNHIANMIKFSTYNGGSELESKDIQNFTAELWFNILRYNAIKAWYDNAIWENGYCKWDSLNKQLLIKIKNYDYAVLRYIGLYRIQSDAFTRQLLFLKRLDKDIHTYDIPIDKISIPFKEYKNNIMIDHCYIKNGYIKYKLKSTNIIKKSTIARLYSPIAKLSLYYEFILNEHLELLNLSLMNLLVLINLLEELVIGISKLQINGNDNLCYKIKVNTLEEYFKRRSTFSITQIRAFMSLLLYSSEDKGYNFWQRLIVQHENYYVFPLLNAHSPNILYLIDEWLNKAGYDLKKRGLLFENYIKTEVKILMDEKKYAHILPQRKKFKYGVDEEEIDIILNTKHSVLIGDIKCIRHPLGVIDYYKFYDKLTKGAEQVEKKVNFLKRHKDFFINDIGDIENKEIIKVVITNYPLFSGIKINDIVIIDFSLLAGYIYKGGYTVEAMIGDTKITKENEKYYNNEDEFSKNLRPYIHNITVIKRIKRHFGINLHQMKLDEDNELHAEFIELQEDFFEQHIKFLK